MEAKTTVLEGPSLPSLEEKWQEKGLSNNAQEDDFSNKVGGGDAADGHGDAAYVASGQASVAESLAAEREGWGEGDERFDLEAIWTAAREEERKQELKAAEKLRGKLQEQQENDQQENDFSDDLSEQDELPSDFSL